MQTKYFGEYVEKTNNTAPAGEYEGYIRVHKIKDDYFPYIIVDGKSYDVPKFMIPYTNRKVAFIGRKYAQVKNNVTYNKFVIITCKIIDRYNTQVTLEDIEIPENLEEI